MIEMKVTVPINNTHRSKSKTFGGPRPSSANVVARPVRQLALSYVAILRAVRRNVK